MLCECKKKRLSRCAIIIMGCFCGGQTSVTETIYAKSSSNLHHTIHKYVCERQPVRCGPLICDAFRISHEFIAENQASSALGK